MRTLDAENLQKYLKSEKTAAANILKEEKPIRSQRNRPGKYQKINEILHLWYQRCCASNNYPNGEMAMAIKESLQDSSLDQFRVWVVRYMGKCLRH